MKKLGTLGSSAALFTLALGVSTPLTLIVAPQPAQAEDCLLDTNDNGTATATTDTDGGAESGVSPTPERLACGPGATATGSFSTAVGADTVATATDSTAVGNGA